jgi:RNA polymerase I-specific transcription initiation factor RRN7
VFSSQSEGDSTDDETKKRKRNHFENSYPRVIDGVCLCYLGILLLRLPVTAADVYAWISDGQLLYYRAIKTVDMTMKSRLPGRYHSLLDPQHLLKPETLHTTIQSTITMYGRSFGMDVPATNHHVFLYRLIQDLALPLEVYAATVQLASMLQINFSYEPDSLTNARSSVVLRLAEGKLVAILIVATKLLFPFDDIVRRPRHATDLNTLGMDWTKWSQARRTAAEDNESNDLTYDQATRTTEDDILQMSNDKLDQYMDWYEKVFIDDDLRETGRAGKEVEFRRTMFRCFPITRPDYGHDPRPNQNDDGKEESSAAMPEHRFEMQENNKKKMIQAVQASLRTLQTTPESAMNSHVYRAGSFYKRYRQPEDLTGHAKEFFEEAAKVVGLSLESLILAVFAIERKVEAWEQRARDRDKRRERSDADGGSNLG